MNVAEVAIQWRIGDALLSYCVIHVKKSDGADPFDEDDLNALGVAVDTWWGIGRGAAHPMRELYAEEVMLVHTKAKRIEPDEGDPVVYPIGVIGVLSDEDFEWEGIVADTTANPFPPQVAWLITLHTAMTGSRSARGRLFLPATDVRRHAPFGIGDFPDRVEHARGIVPEAVIAKFAASIAALHLIIQDGSPEGEPWALCVYSRKLRESWAVTRYEWSRFLRTQRERADPNGWWAQIDQSGDVTGERFGEPQPEE